MTPTMRLPVIFSSLAFLWWLLSNGDPSSWLVGAPVVLVATWAAWQLNPSKGMSISLVGTLRFLPFFFAESLRGGIDVARRVLQRHLNVVPGFVSFRTRLSGQRARLLFINSVSLLPGTLAADLQEDHLKIHALDRSVDFTEDLRRLEVAVGRIYQEVL